MAIYDLTVSIPSSVAAGDILNCPYSGTYKSITLPPGVFQLECWGAQGGNSTYGGKGAYTKGTLTLTSSTTVHLYSGGMGVQGNTSSTVAGGFNGGGTCPNSTGNWYSPYPHSGGGASDIRLGSTSSYARVLVAGGGGGASGISGGTGSGGAAGGSGSASDGTLWCCGPVGRGASQTAGGAASGTASNGIYSGYAGSFGLGGNGSPCGSYNAGSGGGGGWYGGGGSSGGCGGSGGGGGSSYVYTAATAANYPSGVLLNSTHYLADTVNVGGTTSFTDYSGSTVTGHAGNGATRITVLSAGTSISDTTTPAIKKTSVTLSSSVSFSGGDTFTDCGFCYSQTNATPTTADSKVSLGAKSTSGTITGDLAVVLHGKYYVRAYGILPSAEVKYGNVLTYTHAVIPTGAVTSNGNISTVLPGLVKGKTYYIRPYGVKQDNSVIHGNVTTYVHDYMNVGNISIFKSYTSATLSTSNVSDLLIGNSYVYHVVSAMNTVYCYNKNADGTVGSLITSYNWYNADSTINTICRNSSSVPSAYALYVRNGVDYLVGWSMDSAILYEWTIDAATHLPTNRQSYNVCAQACNSYSRGGWGGKDYVYFLNRTTWGIYRWDLNNKSAAMVLLGTVPSSNLDSSYTGSGLMVNEAKGEAYWGDGSNESNGLLGAFNYKTGTMVKILTGSELNTFGVPSISGDNGTIQLSAMHPNIGYYIYFSTQTIRYLTIDLGMNNTPSVPTLSSPTTSGYTFNKRPPLVINVPYDADEDSVQVRASFKSGSTVLDTQTSTAVQSTVKNMLTNAELNGTTGWSGASAASSSVSGNTYTFTCGAQWGHVGTTLPITCTTGDILYYRAWVKNPYPTLDLCRIGLGYTSTGNSVWTTASTPVSSNWQLTSGVVTTTATTHYFACYDTSTSGWLQIQFHSPIVVNLTKLFGPGKEKNKAWCDANINMLVNLVTNSGFENGTSGWTPSAGVTAVTYPTPYGAQCAKSTSTAQWAGITPVTRPAAVANHKYYFRLAHKVVSITGGGMVYHVIGACDSGGTVLAWSPTYLSTTTPCDWSTGGAVFTTPANTASMYLALLYHDVAAAIEAYIDGCIMIDLTLAYGAGNEPTQAWCDANIPYFDGTLCALGSGVKTLYNQITAKLSNGISGWSADLGSGSVSNNTMYVTGTGGAATLTAYTTINSHIVGHKYYFSGNVSVADSLCSSIKFPNSYPGTLITCVTSPVINTKYKASGVFTAVDTYGYYALIAYYADAATANGKVMSLDSPIIIDLTQMFGAGNEPTQAWCDANIPFFETMYAFYPDRKISILPTVDLPAGTITVDLDTYDGKVWSEKKTATFTIEGVPPFSVQAADTGISVSNIQSLIWWIQNIRSFRGLSTTPQAWVTALVANASRIDASNLTTTRALATEALTTSGITPTWTDPTIVAGQTPRKGTHWIEIFNYLKQV